MLIKELPVLNSHQRTGAEIDVREVKVTQAFIKSYIVALLSYMDSRNGWRIYFAK